MNDMAQPNHAFGGVAGGYTSATIKCLLLFSSIPAGA
jgi:hypothetical protein